ncbi:hypothetical protein [Falsiroseomonas oryzae]|uniref:hypothetical protein n=1 Tax=Falsiroseomonas oryzae TaxID=2766473 RepID=UPI0022EB5F94|nr:hypothetical protein [Roseomonas sp. MO-31]
MASSASVTKRGSAKPRGKGAATARGALARWWKVALLVVLATIGLPLAHAIFGEVAALLGGATLLGFLLGRWTAR